MHRLGVLMILLLTLALSGTAAASSLGAGDPYRAASGQHARRDYGVFSSAERNLIRSGLREADRRETAGTPTADFPPVWQRTPSGKMSPAVGQKKFSRGDRLGSDDYARGVMLPDDLLSRLPTPPPGTEILRMGEQVVRLDAATRVILDVFDLGGH